MMSLFKDLMESEAGKDALVHGRPSGGRKSLDFMFAQPIWCGEADKREDEIPGSYKLVGRSQAMTKSIACARTHTHTQTHTQRGNLVDMFRVDGSCSLDIDYNFGG